MADKNKQKGFTIVELVVVIGIMAVMLTVIGISLNTIFYNRTKSATRNIYNMIGAAQTLGMGKDNVVFGIEGSSDGLTAFIGTSTDGGFTYTKVEEKNLGNKLQISARGNGWNMSFSAGNTNIGSLVIPIDRRTGGFKKAVVTVAGTHEEPSACTEMRIGSGSNEKVITLVPLTGKISYE